jgi:hypothetical protein
MKRIGRKRRSNSPKTIITSAFLISIRERKGRKPMGRTSNPLPKYHQSIVRKKIATLLISTSRAST